MFSKRLKRKTIQDIIFDTINTIIMLFLLAVTLYPFINTLAVSLNDAMDTIRGGIYFWPREFTTSNYRLILENKDIYNATLISILRAVTGSLTSVSCCVMVAYALSRKEYVLRRIITRLLVFTMYFSGGLIPVYFVIRDLGLTNNFLVYIIPGMVNAFNIMVVRSYIDSLPESFAESAKIDGASEFRILVSIIFPLCLPVVATITLFVAVGQWNSWFDTFLYCSSKKSLSTLQYELQKVLQQANTAMQDKVDFAGAREGRGNVTPASIRATMTIIATLPIIMVYPFLQKYFVKGMTLGGVKG